MIYAKKLSEVWSKRPVLFGRTMIVQGVSTVLENGRRIGKIALYFNKKQISKVERQFGLVYFPTPNHSSAFRQASKNIGYLGYEICYQGTVGSIIVGQKENKLRIYTFSPHFNVGPKNRGGVTPVLAKKYKGWRNNLLRELFKLAQSEGVTSISNLSISPNSFTGKMRKTIAKRQEDFRKIAEEHGYKLVI
ncbi:MAG TPA: hypothetical protein PKK60_04495, partial [archaeon]|nr:hypothetical protein [archaeon]